MPNSIPISYGWQIWNGLVEVDANGEAVGELAESFEAKPGATTWIFNIRKGITFTSGKTLDADDVIYSLNLHRGETKSGAKDLLSASPTSRSSTRNQIEFTLKSGDAGFPYCVRRLSRPDRAQRLHRFLEARRHRRLCARELRAGRARHHQEQGQLLEAGPRQFRQHRASLHPRLSRARSQALVSGQIDAANRLDAKTVGLVMKAPTVNVVRTKGTGNRFAFVAHCDTDPYTSNDIRLALKYGIDRQKIVDTVYKGFATIGNDTTVAPSSKVFRQGHPAAPLRSRQGGLPFQEGGHGQCEVWSCRSRKARSPARPTRRCSTRKR